MLAAGAGSTWATFLPSMSLLGFGIGLVFAPLTTIAMRKVPERLVGAASGTLNTMRQAGSVAGTAAVGALLQNRLVSSLTSQATAHAAALPPAARVPFVDGFRQMAASGTFGTGSGTQLKLPPGTPSALARELARVAGIVFGHGYVDAMRSTMVLPVAVVALAALTALALRNDRPAKAIRARPYAAGPRCPAHTDA